MSRASLAIAALLAVIACRDAPPPPASGPAPQGFVEVPGGRVFYKTMGGGGKTPLLLLHGGPGGRSCGVFVLADRATDRRVIRYDQLGSGQSAGPVDLTLLRTQPDVQALAASPRPGSLREVH